jgi:hypothetical protein
VDQLLKMLVIVAGSGMQGLLNPSQTPSLEYWRQRFMVQIDLANSIGAGVLEAKAPRVDGQGGDDFSMVCKLGGFDSIIQE